MLSFCLLSSKWASTAGAHSPRDGFEGSVHSWILTGPITESGWSCPCLEPTCRLVYFECKHYANSPGSWTAFWRKSVRNTRFSASFKIRPQTGFSIVCSVLTDWHEHLDLWAIFQLNLMGHKYSREARLLWTHGLSNLMKVTGSYLHTSQSRPILIRHATSLDRL